ncbi:MAG: MBL fold metallo-hydrolase [bacterium]|nr:MBL fold metallo-hydrolase [bacterium]
MNFQNEFLKIRRPRIIPFVFFKMLGMTLSGLFDFAKPMPARFKTNPADLTDPTKLTITYIGHATLFINFFGTTILTDPIFSDRVGLILKRIIKPGLAISELPKLDYLLISHAHLDHLNRPSLRKLAPIVKTLIIPKNCTDLVADLGFKNIIELHWGEETPSLGVREGGGELRIRAFRPAHWGTRWPWERIHRGYNSYILQKNGVNILFAGDSGYSKTFQEISRKYPIYVAILPITAYNPPEFRVMHMNPEDAVQTFEETGAKYLIPIHWGVFKLSFEPIDEPPELIARLMQVRGRKDSLKLLPPGASLSLPD